MKKNEKNKKVSDKVLNAWFDSENASLIILCATLGIFGAHKFAQHKIGQGILFLLLDMTIFGIFVSFVWAFLDLIFLTAKQNNKPGNMFLGAVFIIANLAASAIISGADLFLGTRSDSKTVVQDEKFTFGEQLSCNGGALIDIVADSKKADLIIDKDIITLPIKINSEHTKVYEGYWDMETGIRLVASSNSHDKFFIKIDADRQRPVKVIGKLYGNFGEYECRPVSNTIK